MIGGGGDFFLTSTMTTFAVTDDGPATELLAERAVPRLWTPGDAAQPVPPAATPSPRQPRSGKPKPASVSKPASRPSPDSAAVVRDRYNPILKDLPPEERPRERLHAYGAQALTTAELIAILIRTGNGERSAVALGEFLLAEFGSIQGVATASSEQLAAVKGLGAAKAAQIKAAIEFGNRLALFTEEGRPAIGGPQDVSNLLMPDLRYQKKEHLKSILLNTKNRVLAIKTVCTVSFPISSTYLKSSDLPTSGTCTWHVE